MQNFYFKVAKSEKNLMLTPMITSNQSATLYKKQMLVNYIEENVLSDHFNCKMYELCKSSHNGLFYEGQLHHVGNFYDLKYNGIPFRIVIVGQEYGYPPARVSFEKRYNDIMHSALDMRFRGENNFKSRNPHMKGTTNVLKALFGLPLNPAYENEFILIDNVKQHVFDSFSLINYLLCSAVNFESGSKGKSTTVMKENCNHHFRCAIEIMAPNVIIVQGKSFFPWVKKSFDKFEKISPSLYNMQIKSQEFLVAEFTHPSSHFPYNWGANEKTDYLLNTVVPTVDKIRKLIGIS